MAIYRDFVVKIPKEASISLSNKRVYLTTLKVYDRKKQYNVNHRLTIGQFIDNDNMHPNDNFKEQYPEEWKKFENAPLIHRPIIKIGGYVYMNLLIKMLGLDQILESTFKPTKAKRILDYVMYSIENQNNVAATYSETMINKMLFSDKNCSDSTYANLFSKEITRQSVEDFKNKWLKHIAGQQKSNRGVILCIDGSNDDCSSKGVELVEKQHDKSDNNNDIVSFMYALDPEEGIPITFELYRGELVDSNALDIVLKTLENSKLKINRIVMDRGFCTKQCVDHIKSLGIDYEIMIKPNTTAFSNMIEKNRKTIKWNVKHRIKHTHLFGITEKMKLFKSSETDSYIHLFFDWKNSGDSTEKLILEAEEALEKAQAQINQGTPVEIANKYRKYLIIEKDNNQKDIKSVRIDYDKLQEDVDTKGISLIATSDDITAEQCNHYYDLRDACEKQFSMTKTQLGYGKARIRTDDATFAKFLIGFIAGIIRSKFRQICKTLSLSTNEMIRECSILEAKLLQGNVYRYIHSEDERQQSLLKALNGSVEDLEIAATTETNRIKGIVSVKRKRKPGPKPGSHNNKYDEESNIIPKKPGPKPGSHHKKYDADGNLIKAKPGPKPGSRNKRYDENGNIIRKKPGPKPGSHHKPKEQEKSIAKHSAKLSNVSSNNTEKSINHLILLKV